MPDTIFKVLGTEQQPMLGRKIELGRLMSSLLKESPDHVSIVGPRYCGKSVFLKGTLEKLSSEGSQFDAIDLWDLGHQTPSSDADFVKQLKNRLADALRDSPGDTSQFLDGVDGSDYSEFEEIIRYASNQDGLKILLLWDGFDKPLHSGLLTRNLWDQLREFAMIPGICLVTASRRPLHELLRSEDAATSDFWGIFESAINLSCFSDTDCDEILASLEDIEFDRGARSELQNYSSGYPPLFLSMLNRISVSDHAQTIDSQAVCAAGDDIDDNAINIVRDMWTDCSTQAQDLYRSLLTTREVLDAGIPKDHSSYLFERGFARKVGNKIHPACRLLERLLESIEGGTVGLGHLFGTWTDYRQNVRRVLEHRLSHIQNIDDVLRRLVSRAIEDIPDYPNECLNSLTRIQESALDCIWRKEFGEEKYFPEQIWDDWDETNRSLSTKQQVRIIADLRDSVNKPITTERWLQMGMLQLLTGSRQYFETKAKFATKDMYVLLNAIHSFRNRTEHADGEKMGVGVAVAGLMICLELLGCIDQAQ